jgi:hypothetical protein
MLDASVISYTSSGLCNRIGNLLNALHLSQLSQKPLVAYWLPSTTGDFRYSDLFCGGLDELTLPIEEFMAAYAKETLFVSHRKKTWSEQLARYIQHEQVVEPKRNFIRTKVINLTKQPHAHLLIRGNKPFRFLEKDTQFLKSSLLYLQPIPSIQKKIDALISTYDVNRSTYGLHARQTDHPDRKPYSFYENIVRKKLRKSSNAKFFLATDCSVMENKLKTQFKGHIIVFPKEEFPEKIDDESPFHATKESGWSDKFSIHSKYNIYRSRLSVQEAVVDLMVLARTNIVATSPGSFSDIASLLSTVI